jgi:shikimate kinase
MNVVLIGYRGTGKSTVADLIAAATGATPFHTDVEIERRIRCSIADYVRANGWDAFRDVESEIVAVGVGLADAVIDTGGGVVTRPANVAALRKNGVVFWLQAAPDTIRARIADALDRPPLTGGQSFVDEIETVLAERTPLYQAAADYTIATDGRSPDEIAARVVMLLDKRREA